MKTFKVYLSKDLYNYKDCAPKFLQTAIGTGVYQGSSRELIGKITKIEELEDRILVTYELVNSELANFLAKFNQSISNIEIGFP